MTTMEEQIHRLRIQLISKFYDKLRLVRLKEGEGYPLGANEEFLTKGEAFWYYDVSTYGEGGVIATKEYHQEIEHKDGKWMFLAHTFNGTIIYDDSREVAEMFLGFRIFKGAM